MTIRKLSNYIKDYGLYSAAVRTADRLLKRKAEEVSYEKWLQRSRKSSRDYGRMSKESFAWNPVIGVKAYMDVEDRTPFMQSLALQIYREFRSYKNYPEADYILIAGGGCILSPDLLWQAVSMLNEEGMTSSLLKDAPALIYFDSDRIGEDGHKTDPAFRPDYDEDLLEGVNYMGSVVMVRGDLVQQVPLPTDAEESFHEFLKKICRLADVKPGHEKDGAVRHIAQVLYHDTSKRPAQARPAGTVLGGDEAEDREPLVSILIPNKDHREDLERCILSLHYVNNWSNLEILILENNSTQRETFDYYEQLRREDSRVRILRYEKPFNYSAINNFGAANANGEYLLLLNNDTFMLKEDSVRQLVNLVKKESTGAAGALLYYPDRTVQHAGIILGHGGIAGHAFAGEVSGEEIGSFPGMVYAHTHNVCAVTGACLMVKRSVYLKAGGLDEALEVAFNDVDFCMRLRQQGLKILMCPQAQLYHNESISRGEEDTPEKVARFHREISVFVSRWEDELEAGDPFYNPNLTLNGRSWTCTDEVREPAKPYLKYLYIRD